MTYYIELANLWGDAGDVSDKVSWIFKGSDNETQFYISKIESHDNSVDSGTDRTINIRRYNYLIRLTEDGFDTISKAPKLLAGRFRR